MMFRLCEKWSAARGESILSSASAHLECRSWGALRAAGGRIGSFRAVETDRGHVRTFHGTSRHVFTGSNGSGSTLRVTCELSSAHPAWQHCSARVAALEAAAAAATATGCNSITLLLRSRQHRWLIEFARVLWCNPQNSRDRESSPPSPPPPASPDHRWIN